MFGIYNSCSKLHVVQWASESALLVYHVFRSHDMVIRCPRRQFFQIRCDDHGCEQCTNNGMDLGDATTIYLPVLVAVHLLHLLPVKGDRDQEINSRSFGKVLPSDVDFAKFTTHTGKL